MKKASNIWVRRGLLLHRLHLLHKFARPFWKKKYALTARRLENFWQTLNGGELSLTIVVYIAANVLCWITVKRAITRAS